MRSILSPATLGLRASFIDFLALLRKYIDFDEIAAWGPRSRTPVLLVGAVKVSTGKLVKFVSAKEAIRLEHILTCCAVPNIFPAVRIGEHAYWDGLFSDNPPVEEMMRPRSVGPENVPEEIWLIKINPTACGAVPEQADASTPIRTSPITYRASKCPRNCRRRWTMKARSIEVPGTSITFSNWGKSAWLHFSRRARGSGEGAP